MIPNFFEPTILVPQPPGGILPPFNGTLREDLDDDQIDNRVTNYPITLHGGPVMANPGNFLATIKEIFFL